MKSKQRKHKAGAKMESSRVAGLVGGKIKSHKIALKMLRDGKIEGFVSRLMNDGWDVECFKVLKSFPGVDGYIGRIINAKVIELLNEPDSPFRVYGNENGANEDHENVNCSLILNRGERPVFGNILFVRNDQPESKQQVFSIPEEFTVTLKMPTALD